MAENDLSRIVGLIMENPALIEEIKNLGRQKTEEATAATEVLPTDTGEDEIEKTAEAVALPRATSRRRELLYALKPYVSEQRGRAIESMLSIVDIVDMMRSR